MVMRLDVRAAALAAGSITALVYITCTAFCFFVPESTLIYVTTVLFHIDLSDLYRESTWAELVISLLGWGLGTASVAGTTAWLYNLAAQTALVKTNNLAGQQSSPEARRAS